MPVTSRALVEFVLLGPTTDRRQLQDSPILGDVWIAFANEPSKPHDLLISPYKTCSGPRCGAPTARRLRRSGGEGGPGRVTRRISPRSGRGTPALPRAASGRRAHDRLVAGPRSAHRARLASSPKRR